MVHKVILVVVGALFGWGMLQLVFDHTHGLLYVWNTGMSLMVTWLVFAGVSTMMVCNRPRDLLAYFVALVLAGMAGTTFTDLYSLH
jgi:hypothetical protein